MGESSRAPEMGLRASSGVCAWCESSPPQPGEVFFSVSVTHLVFVSTLSACASLSVIRMYTLAKDGHHRGRESARERESESDVAVTPFVSLTALSLFFPDRRALLKHARRGYIRQSRL